MSTRERVVGFVGRCKACGKPARVDVPELVEPRRTQVRNAQGHWHDKEVRRYALFGGGWYGAPSKKVTAPCPHCGTSCSLSRVAGTFNAEIKCGAKCRNATGPNCECSCAGLNHGVGS